MLSEMYDDPDFAAYFKHAESEMLPKMKDSSMVIALCTGKVDVKLCLEVGAAVLFDKPIVAVISGGMPVSANLKRVASVIIEGDVRDAATKVKLEEAITKVTEHDQRVKR